MGNSPKELIWHCTATPEGREVSRDEIDQWHKARGWRGIGYHKVIHLDGSVSEGRKEWVQGAHVSGHNRNTIGYVYVGGLDKDGNPKDTRTWAQKETMARLTKEAIKKYGLKRISGHREYAAKACPCFDARGEYNWLIEDMKHKDPTDMRKSRTVKGSSVAGISGAAVTVDEGLKAVEEVQRGLDQLQVGTVLGVVVGVVIMAGAMYALYARWDDAGRPSLKEIFS